MSDDARSTEHLAPCPLVGCGERAELQKVNEDEGFVACTGCGVSQDVGPLQDQIDLWNQRTPPPATALGREALADAIDTIDFNHLGGCFTVRDHEAALEMADRLLAAMPTGEVPHTDSAQDSMKSVDGDLVTKARAVVEAAKLDPPRHIKGLLKEVVVIPGEVFWPFADALREALGEVKEDR